MKKIFFIPVILVALALAACNAINPSQSIASAGAGPQAWIDAPLNGGTIPMAPYDIIAHASDEAHVAKIELSVNGAVLSTNPVANTSDTLAGVTQKWTPPGAGHVQNTSPRAE